MTTLYRPVLIETAEQAAALPIGTIAHRGAIATVRVPEQSNVGPWRSGILGWGHRAAIGWTALVPVEAEVEHAVVVGSERGMIIPVTGPEPVEGTGSIANLPRERRYVTRWEPVT